MSEELVKQNDEEEISLKDLTFNIKNWWYYLLSKWKVILIAGAIGGILGFTYAYFKKPLYTAVTTFVLEEGDSGSGGLGAYASLASIAGIDLAGGGGGIFKGDNILELYKSRRMIQETLLSSYTFNGKQQLLIDRYIKFSKQEQIFSGNQVLTKLNFKLNLLKPDRTRDSILGKIVEDINKNILIVSKPDKKLSIINVKVKSEDELFAKAFADKIVDNVNRFYVDTKTKKSNENVAILQKQTDSVRIALNRNIGSVAAAEDVNPNSNSAFQSLIVGSQRRQVDVKANGVVYQELIKNLELAKITLRKEKPLIQVIDGPVLPLEKDKLGKSLTSLIGVIMFGGLFLFFLIIRRMISS